MKLNALLFCVVFLEALFYLNGTKLPKQVYGQQTVISKPEPAYQVKDSVDYFRDNTYSDLHLKNRGKPQVAGWHTEMNPTLEVNTQTESITISLTPTPVAKPVQAELAAAKKQITAPSGIDSLIRQYASFYGVDANLMIKIAKCESGFNPKAVNGPFAGMYQFISGTWISNRKAMGLDPNPALRYDAEESIKTAAFKISRDGAGAWPTCSRV